jgi:metallo-beta-lactamase class B
MAPRCRMMCVGVFVMMTAACEPVPTGNSPGNTDARSAADSSNAGRNPGWPAEWLEPTKPFHIADSIYYVGSAGLGAFLVATPQGHVLIDGGLPQTAPQIEVSIGALGFRLEDVKILLNTHAHFDHSGGLATLKSRSGAALYAHEGDVSALQGGFYLGSENVAEYRAPPVVVDRALRDGAVVELGGRKLVLHHTPGHSRGCSSWEILPSEPENEQRVLVFCSASVAANRLVGPPQYPGIVDDYRATFERLRDLHVDIPLAPHPEFFDLLAKRDRAQADPSRNPFVDPGGFRALIARFELEFEAELMRQTAAAGQ